MKKSDYIPFHCSQLFALFKYQNKFIIYKASKNVITLSSFRKDEIKDEQELLKHLLNKARMNLEDSLIDSYIKSILKHGNDEQVLFFIKNSNSLVGRYSFNIDIFNLFSKEQIADILNETSSSFLLMNTLQNVRALTPLLSILNKHFKKEECIPLLSQFITKRYHEIEKSGHHHELLEFLITNFEYELIQFKDIPCVSQYLYDRNNPVSMIEEVDFVRTQYLQVNCHITKNQYPITGLRTHFYVNRLRDLMWTLVDLKKHTGIVSMNIDDSCHKDYKFTPIYLNINESCQLQLKDYHAMLNAYFEYVQQLFTHNPTANFDIHEWVKKYLFSYDLENKLEYKDIPQKQSKI